MWSPLSQMIRDSLVRRISLSCSAGMENEILKKGYWYRCYAQTTKDSNLIKKYQIFGLKMAVKLSWKFDLDEKHRFESTVSQWIKFDQLVGILLDWKWSYLSKGFHCIPFKWVRSNSHWDIYWYEIPDLKYFTCLFIQM